MKKTILTALLIGASLIGNAQIYDTQASSIANGKGTTVITTGVNAGQITAGSFTGTSDFNPGSGVYNLTAGSNGSMYVQSLGTTMDFYWAFAIPNAGATKMIAATDGIYIVGSFTGTVDFDPNPSVSNSLTSNGNSDCFIMKINYSNGSLIWVKSFGGTDQDLSVHVCTDASITSDYIYVTGTFKGTADLDPTPTTTSNHTSAGGTDIFVIKLNAAGTFQWARRTGGSGGDYPTDIQATATEVTMCGGFTGTVDFNPNAGINNLVALNWSNEAAFLVRWNNTSTYQWSRLFDQPEGYVRIHCMLVTPTNIYIAGDIFETFYYSTTSGTSAYVTPNNLNAAFYAKLDAVGFGAEWVQLVDNPPGTPQSQETITDMIFGGGTTGIYLVGTFLGTTSFTPTSVKQATISSTGLTQTFFIFKILQTGAYKWGYALTNAEGGGYVPQLALSYHGGYNHIYTTAKFTGTQDFDFNGSVLSRTAVGPYDAFTAKWSDDNQ